MISLDCLAGRPSWDTVFDDCRGFGLSIAKPNVKSGVKTPINVSRNQTVPLQERSAFANVNVPYIHQARIVKMDWNRVEGNWKQVKGKVKEQWGRLTDDDLDVINGRRDQLEGKIQERYGLAKDQVNQDVNDWYSTQRW